MHNNMQGPVSAPFKVKISTYTQIQMLKLRFSSTTTVPPDLTRVCVRTVWSVAACESIVRELRSVWNFG